MKSVTEIDSNIIALLDAEREITRLISTYPYLVDSGKFDEVAKLLQHATLQVPGHVVKGRAEIEQYFVSGIQRHYDETPRTWHAVSNILVNVDLDKDSATSTSYFTVHQELPKFPLQAICTGRYEDRFAKLDGTWQFIRREVVAHLMGDVKFHVS